MIIREEKQTDINTITTVHNKAFKGLDEGRIVENLRKNKNLKISLVAEVDGIIVGHIAYSPIYNNSKEVIGIGLAPVAVLPAYQNQCIGSNLIKQGNEEASARGFNKIFVLGNPEYYYRFGFKNAKEYNYFSHFDPEENHFMVMGEQLERKAEKTFVNYCSEFNV